MREWIARAVTLLTLTALVALAAALARVQNPVEFESASTDTPVEGSAAPPAEPSAPAAVPQAADSARGLALFQSHGCDGCHSAAEVGNPRIPLDGVGSRRSLASLRDWTIGAEAIADSISPSALRRKQGYTRLPEDELDAIVAFLARLKEVP